MLAAEKIVKFLRGQGPGREAEGSQSSETAPAGWLARWLASSLAIRRCLGHVRRGKRHRRGRVGCRTLDGHPALDDAAGRRR